MGEPSVMPSGCRRPAAPGRARVSQTRSSLSTPASGRHGCDPWMMAEDVVRRSVVAGQDIDDARAMYEAAYNGRQFHIEPTEREFGYRYTIAGDDDVTLRGNRFTGSVEGTVQVQGEYVVTWITAGTGAMDLEGTGDLTPLEPGQPVLFTTGGQNRFAFADYKQNLVHLDGRYLERVAAEVEGHDGGPLRFRHGGRLEDHALQRWTAAVRTVNAVGASADASALLRSEVNRLAAVSLLSTFPHEATSLPPELLLPRHRRVRTAVEFIHANAHLPITLTDVAAAANVSSRSLQQAFERALATSPTRYLRQVRLERVRAELLEQHPEDVSVGDVARRWGFVHLGRFSGAYAAAFGEYPRETLYR
ncbi:hypothetical protein DEI92_15300 [Curtobacterium sp. MCBD17_034]|nr:hypothetical protein DEI92_15300 [Curtobacterium sp. MCBD17_034]PZM32970.1 hypothetical protein DEI90_15290 [Curtobacterium sp. MCBD17_031]